MNRLKEIAKFASGAEAFHAFIHAYFWQAGTTVKVLGWFEETPTVHIWSAVVNGAVSLVLGLYAWGALHRR